MKKPQKTKLELFEERYFINIYNGCFEWIGGKFGDGYGAFRGQKAHRESFRIYRGIEPGELHVCHHCDNPICVNPAHLFLGTRSDNMLDAYRKGRLKIEELAKRNKSEPRGIRKLSWGDVQEIRNAVGIPYKVLAERYGITTQYVYLIRAKRAAWLKDAYEDSVYCGKIRTQSVNN